MSTDTLAPLTSILLQYFAPVSAEQVSAFRADGAALAAFVAAPDTPRTSLGMYWHAVPFLITGVPTNQDEPYGFFLTGGEVLGRNAAGDVRYLSPTQVSALARALKEEEPDELGMGGFDEARLDRRGIYPERWERTSDGDHLGTMRELYSYVRDLARATSRAKQGLLVYFDTQPYDDSEDADAASASPRPAEPEPEPAPHGGAVVFRGEDGRLYAEADESALPAGARQALPARDAAMAAAGMRYVGNVHPPDAPADVLRAFVSDDRTLGAVLYLSARGVGGCCFYSRLPEGLVASSSAFIVQMAKFGFFADFLQDAPPARLRKAVVTRRAKLQKTLGLPIALEPTLAAVASLWEEQHVRCRRGF